MEFSSWSSVSFVYICAFAFAFAFLCNPLVASLSATSLPMDSKSCFPVCDLTWWKNIFAEGPATWRDNWSIGIHRNPGSWESHNDYWRCRQICSRHLLLSSWKTARGWKKMWCSFRDLLFLWRGRRLSHQAQPGKRSFQVWDAGKLCAVQGNRARVKRGQCKTKCHLCLSLLRMLLQSPAGHKEVWVPQYCRLFHFHRRNQWGVMYRLRQMCTDL